MIKSVTVTNDIGKQLILELARPDLSGLAVLSIDGIGPGKATINVREHASMDGDTFNSSRIPSRNITMQIRFYPVPGVISVEQARRLSYQFFSPRKKISLRFETELRTCDIDGYVESNEPNIFAEKTGCSISIICPNPFFRALEPQNTEFYFVNGVFEFPFSNESLHYPQINLGDASLTHRQLLKYEGDADTGIIVHMNFINTVAFPYIKNATMDEIFRIDTNTLSIQTGSAIQNGDQIVICTEKGNKYAKLTRNGETMSIIGSVDFGSTWIQLHSGGEQVFEYGATTGVENMQVHIQNKVLYEGV